MIMNSLIIYVVVGLILGMVIVVISRKRRTAIIFSSIPGVLGILSLTYYYMQKASCDESTGCEMGQAGMLSLYGYVLVIFSVFCISMVLIVNRSRAIRRND